MSLIAEGLNFSYKRGAHALKDISFTLQQGELTALIGQNGCGKSTLIKCINGILSPDAGQLRYNGADLQSMGLMDRSRLMSYVPQTVPGTMNFKVFDVVLMGRRPYLNWGIGKKDRNAVFDVLARTGLEELCFRSYDELSGGQRQKVLIARALVQEPEVLIMDEPTSNLDLKHQLDVLLLLKEIAAAKNISILLSAHDLNLVMNYADRLIMMKNGSICHKGTAEDVLTAGNIKDAFDVDTHVGHHKGTAFVLVEKK